MRPFSMRALRVLSLSLAVLLLLPTLAACSGDKNSSLDVLPSEHIQQEVFSYNALKPLTLPDVGSHVQVQDCRGDLLVLYSEDTSGGKMQDPQLSVYNVATNRIVFTSSQPAVITLYGCGLFSVSDNRTQTESAPTYVSRLYDAKGKLLLDSDTEIMVTEADGEATVTCDGVGYWYDREQGRLERTGATMNTRPISTSVTAGYAEDYLFEWDSERVWVYAKESGRMVAYYAFPSYVTSRRVFPLNNGNVLLQYLVSVSGRDGNAPEDSEYDIERRKVYDSSSSASSYYSLTTLLLSADSGKTSEVELPYILETVTTAYREKDRSTSLGEGTQNLASAVPIPADKLVDDSDDARCLLKLGNDASVTRLKKVREDQIGFPMTIYKDRYLVSTTSERTYLYDGEGKLIGDVTDSTRLEHWILSATGVFDYDGELILDLGEAQVKTAVTSRDFILFSGIGEKAGQLFLFDGRGDALTLLADADEKPTVVWNTTYGGCFLLSVEDETGSCTYRLYGHEYVIKTFDSKPRILQATSAGLLLCAEEEGEIHYYLLCTQYKV